MLPITHHSSPPTSHLPPLLLLLPLPPSNSYNFFAGDDVFLGAATRAYAKEGSNWRRSYYMPTSTDAAIVALRRWLEKYAGGAIPWPAHLQVCGGGCVYMWGGSGCMWERGCVCELGEVSIMCR